MSTDAAPARLRELTDFAAPWAVSIAATLRLSDHIEAGATRLDELAELAGADPDALDRLLRYLVAQGVFAEEDGAYANTEVSRLLLGEAGWRPWLDLDDAPGHLGRVVDEAARGRSYRLARPGRGLVRGGDAPHRPR